MNRREFLRHAAQLSGAVLLTVSSRGWAASLTADALSTNRRLIVIFLRGAVDGLNVVVPYGDSRYYEARPTIAVPSPGKEGGVLDLDGHFGLHPALEPLMPYWQAKTLGFVHASGSPDPSRSHFDAQAYMEAGTPGRGTTPDGWMNRLLAALPGPHAPTTALSLSATLPRIFSGPQPVANLPLGRNAARPLPLDRPRVAAAFADLYAGDGPLAQAFREGQAARSQVMNDLQQDMADSANGAPPADDGFSQDTGHLAELMRRDASIRLAFLSVGGWDTHVNQGASEGQLAKHLQSLGQGLEQLVQGLGDTYQDTAILVLSEFGRTVRENGNGGTDHGHGNVIWLLGGTMNGGKVHGSWPGLGDDQLYQGRDLAITTDFRQVAATLVTRHLRVPSTNIDAIFPEGLGQSGELTGLMHG